MSKLEAAYQEPFDTWRNNPTKETTGALLKAVDPVISAAMRTYGNTGSRSPTLRGRAKLLAADAFKSYDPARGSMKTHLMSRLQRLQRYAAQERQIIPMPEQVAMDQIRTKEAMQELEDRLGRPPSDGELADYTGISVRRLQHIRHGSQLVAQGTLMQPGRDPDRGNYDPTTQSLAPADDDAWLEFVYGDLDPTDQFIMERVLGMHGHPPTSPSEVARLLKISPAAVSHRTAKLQTLLDRREELGVL